MLKWSFIPIFVFVTNFEYKTTKGSKGSRIDWVGPFEVQVSLWASLSKMHGPNSPVTCNLLSSVFLLWSSCKFNDQIQINYVYSNILEKMSNSIDNRSLSQIYIQVYQLNRSIHNSFVIFAFFFKYGTILNYYS